MGLLDRFRSSTSSPQGHRPSDTDVQTAASELNAGNPAPADALVDAAGDYSQETAMRVMAASVIPPTDAS